LDSSVRPCGRARGVAGVGVVYQAECNPLAKLYNEVLNRHNEIPITSGVMEDTFGFWSYCCGHC
jgi:hypothetical protein